MAGERLTRCDQAKLIQLARAYDLAICCGYVSTRDRLFGELAVLGPQASQAFGRYRSRRLQAIERQRTAYQRRTGQLTQRLAGATRDRKRQLEHDLSRYRRKLHTLQLLRVGLEDAYVEMSLQVQWRQRGPAFGSALEVIRSFEHFARKRDWVRAAGCLSSGDPAQARDWYRKRTALNRTHPSRLTWRTPSLGGKRISNILALTPAENATVKARALGQGRYGYTPALAVASLVQDESGDWLVATLKIK